MKVLDINQRVADRLLAEGRISAPAHKLVVDTALRDGRRVEDVLIDQAVLTEAELLKYLATVYTTSFISTEKLYSAKISQTILDLVPGKLAELHEVMPVLYAAATDTLSVVTSKPDDLVAFSEVKFAAGVKEVRPLLGRPAAIIAAVQRAYFGDPTHFVSLRDAIVPTTSVKPAAPKASSAAPGPIEAERARDLLALGIAPLAPEDLERRRDQYALGIDLPTSMPAGAAGIVDVQGAPIATPPRAPGRRDSPEPTTAVRVPAAPQVDVAEVIAALVTEIDATRSNLERHSTAVAEWVMRLCARLGVPPATAANYRVAALLHDVGKDGAFHVTQLNVERHPKCRASADETHDVNHRFFANARLSPETVLALVQMYERFDGQGLPHGAKGAAIDLGARVLTACDSYLDLTTLRSNSVGRILPPPLALAYLEMFRGSLFDPGVLDALRVEIAEQYPEVTAARPVAVLVDPDPLSTSPLDLRLIERGFDVRLARDTQHAVRELRRAVAVVICDADVEAMNAGFDLRARVVQEAREPAAAWVLHTKRTGADVERAAFDLNFDDFIPKPAPPDATAEKIRTLVMRRTAAAGLR